MVVYNRLCELPTPPAEALAHSQRLSEQILHEIQKAGGFISFARFMELALYAPGMGYYSAGLHKLGKEGDYLTAPEISPLLAYSVAETCSVISAALPDMAILELGAGSGVFATDLLLTLEKSNALPTTYYILEISADLRERQKKYFEQHCPHLVRHIQWLDTLDAFEMKGLIFANEVMDAMPVHCLQIDGSHVQARSVTWQDNEFAWTLTAPSPDLQAALAPLLQHTPFPNHYLTEINLMLPAWIKTLADILKEGVMLLCDYGYGRAEYYHPERSMGTLQCYYAHHRHDVPFQWPGLQDITAHVDFTTVIESATEVGCALAGYTTQSGFLLSSQSLQHMAGAPLSAKAQFQQNQAIKKLILPGQMGEAVKIMAISKLFEQPLPGFTQFDRSRDL